MLVSPNANFLHSKAVLRLGPGCNYDNDGRKDGNGASFLSICPVKALALLCWVLSGLGGDEYYRIFGYPRRSLGWEGLGQVIYCRAVLMGGQ